MVSASGWLLLGTYVAMQGARLPGRAARAFARGASGGRRARRKALLASGRPASVLPPQGPSRPADDPYASPAADGVPHRILTPPAAVPRSAASLEARRDGPAEDGAAPAAEDTAEAWLDGATEFPIAAPPDARPPAATAPAGTPPAVAAGVDLEVPTPETDAGRAAHPSTQAPGGEIGSGAESALSTRRPYASRLVAASIVYLQLIAVAELLVLADPPVGLLMHLGVFALLILHIGRTEDLTTTRVLIALTVAPITRLLSLVMPLGEVPVVWRYALVGVPVLVSAYIALRLAALTPCEVGLRWGRPRVQLPIMLLGIPLGIAEYAILAPHPIVDDSSFAGIVVAGLVLLVFTGFVEEFVFRGTLQTAVLPVFGPRWGIVYVAALFSVLHVGYGSELDLLFVFVVGVLFGALVYRTGSIFGVTLAHGATNLILLVIAPFVTGNAPDTDVDVVRLRAPAPIVRVVQPSMAASRTIAAQAPDTVSRG